MSIAKEVADKTQHCVAVSFAAGYAVVDMRGGRVLFPPGRLINERRTEDGRCTFAEYEYADGSRLEFFGHATQGNSWGEKK